MLKTTPPGLLFILHPLAQVQGLVGSKYSKIFAEQMDGWLGECAWVASEGMNGSVMDRWWVDKQTDRWMGEHDEQVGD